MFTWDFCEIFKNYLQFSHVLTNITVILKDKMLM